METSFVAGMRSRLQKLNHLLVGYRQQQEETFLSEQGTVGLLERSLEALLIAKKFMKKVRHSQISSAGCELSSASRQPRLKSPAGLLQQAPRQPDIFERKKASEPTIKPLDQRRTGFHQAQGSEAEKKNPTAWLQPATDTPRKDQPDTVNAMKSLTFRTLHPTMPGLILQKSKEQTVYKHLDVSVQIHDDKSVFKLEAEHDRSLSATKAKKIDLLKSKRGSLELEEKCFQQLAGSESKNSFFHFSSDRYCDRRDPLADARCLVQLSAQECRSHNPIISRLHENHKDHHEPLDLYEIPPDTTQVIKRTVKGIKSPLEPKVKRNNRQEDSKRHQDASPDTRLISRDQCNAPSTKLSSKGRRQAATGSTLHCDHLASLNSKHSPETSDSIRPGLPCSTQQDPADSGRLQLASRHTVAPHQRAAGSSEKSALLAFIQRCADGQPQKQGQPRPGFKSPPSRQPARLLEADPKGASQSSKRHQSRLTLTSLVFADQRTSIPFKMNSSKHPDIPTRITFE